MQVKKQQLEPDMEQWTGSKLGKEYVKAVYCHPAYLTYMQSFNLPLPKLSNCHLQLMMLNPWGRGKKGKHENRKK